MDGLFATRRSVETKQFALADEGADDRTQALIRLFGACLEGRYPVRHQPAVAGRKARDMSESHLRLAVLKPLLRPSSFFSALRQVRMYATASRLTRQGRLRPVDHSVEEVRYER